MKLLSLFLFVSSLLSASSLTRLQGWCEYGGQTISVLSYTSSTATPVQASYPGCTITVYVTGGAIGTVSATGNAVTWVSGATFNANGQWSGITITINGTNYTISTVNSSTSLTLTTSVSSPVTSVSYSVLNAPAQIYSDNNATPLTNPFTANTSTGFWYFYAGTSYNVDIQLSGGTPAIPTYTLGDVSTGNSSGGGGGGGTITGVVAGNCLSGGGTSGIVTLNVTCGLTLPDNAVIVSNSLGQALNGAAAVQNVNNRAVLRDDQNALDNGNYSTNGIASSITACGTSTPCSVLVPPSYPKTESIPGTSQQNWYDGSAPSAATTSGNVTVYEQRYGVQFPIATNNFGYNIAGNHITSIPQYIYYPNQANLRVFDNIAPYVNVTEALDGGVNQGGAGVVADNKLNWAGGSNTLISWATGQREGIGASTICYGLGDCLAGSYSVRSWSGPNVASDEGTEGPDIEIFGPNVDATGVVASYSYPSLNVSSWTQGQGTQGAGRYAVRSSAGTYTGTVTAFSSPGNGPTVVTAAPATVSTVVGTLGTNVVPSKAGQLVTQSVTPSFTTGSIGLITTSTQVCVADPQGGIEAVYPTAVTGSTFTATFRKPHPSTAIIAAGGDSCTYGFSFNYENASNTQNHLLSGVQVQNITGTLHNVVPVIYTTASAYYLFYATNGQWDQWQALWNTANNGYTLYQIAEIVSVQSGGTVGNTITVAPNNVPWTASDTFFVPAYFSKSFQTGHTLDENYWTNSAFNSGGFGYQYNRPMGVSDTMFGLFNNTDPSLYTNQILIPPPGINIQGYTQSGLNLQYAPDYWVFSIGGPNPGLLDAYPIKLFQIANQDSLTTPTPTGSADDMYYDPYGSNEYWQWTTGARKGATYSMYNTHFDINGGALTLEEFAGGTQVGISLSGSYVIGVGVPQAAYWAYGEACTSPCTSQYHFAAASNSTLQDYLDYDPSGRRWIISANNNAVQYKMDATLYETPWIYNDAGIDSGTSQNFISAENYIFGGVAVPQAQVPCNSSYVGWFSPAYYLIGGNSNGYSTIQYCTNRNGAYSWVNIGTGMEELAYAATLTLSNSPSTYIHLTGNTTLTFPASPYDGEIKNVFLCQDTTGGRTVAVASNVKGFGPLSTTSANTCANQSFQYLYTISEWQPLSQMVQGVTQ